METRFTPTTISMTKAVQALVNVDCANFLNFEDMQLLVNVLSEPLQLNDSLLKSELTIAKHMLAASSAPAIKYRDVLSLLSDDGLFHNLRL